MVVKHTRGLLTLLAGLGLATLTAGCARHSGPTEEGVSYDDKAPEAKHPAEISPYSPLQLLLPFVKEHGGKLTRDQLREDLRKKFNEADKDHDGVLSKKEMRAVNDAMWKQFGAAYTPLTDWDGNDVIDFEEFGGTAWTLFTDLDRNHDNVLTLKEIDPWAAARKKKHPPEPPPPPPHTSGTNPPPPQLTTTGN